MARLRSPRLGQLVRDSLSANGLTSDRLVRVITTIHPAVQSALDDILREASRQPVLSQAAGIVLSNSSGELLGEAAWKDGKPCDFSPAFEGRIQPGSTFKPFAMLSALEQGYHHSMLLKSAPFESTFIRSACQRAWSVRNYGHTYRGTITLRDALILSDNTAFARLVELLDLDALGETYARFGLTPTRVVPPAIVLGAQPTGVSLAQLATAYGAVARGGVYMPLRIVRAALFADGTLWWPPRTVGRLVVKNGAVVHALHAALVQAAGALARFGIAGKTGTTKIGTLFAGYSRELSVALWGEYHSEPSENHPKSITAIDLMACFMEHLFGTGKLLSI